jgi:hypothetical protein
VVGLFFNFLVKDIHNAHVLVTVLNYKLNRESYVLQSKGKTVLYDIHMYFAHKLHLSKVQDFLQVYTGMQNGISKCA